MRIVFALALVSPLALSGALLPACTDESPAPPGGDGGTGDLSAAAADGSLDDFAGVTSDSGAIADGEARDLVGLQTVVCGTTPCVASSEGCCTSSFGSTGSCFPATSSCPSVAASKFDCDGPEDCQGNQVCCYRPMQGAICTPAGGCTQAGALVLCHDGSTCNGVACCPLAPTAAYMACTAGPCVK